MTRRFPAEGNCIVHVEGGCAAVSWIRLRIRIPVEGAVPAPAALRATATPFQVSVRPPVKVIDGLIEAAVVCTKYMEPCGSWLVFVPIEPSSRVKPPVAAYVGVTVATP